MAETNGFWGRAYFDARGLATNDNYFLGDQSFAGAAGYAQTLWVRDGAGREAR